METPKASVLCRERRLTSQLTSYQFLELSGIGNSTRLRALGIEPVIDLPGVGENFQV
jgi:choline dehydrogenase-like flavoprotein